MPTSVLINSSVSVLSKNKEKENNIKNEEMMDRLLKKKTNAGNETLLFLIRQLCIQPMIFIKNTMIETKDS